MKSQFWMVSVRWMSEGTPENRMFLGEATAPADFINHCIRNYLSKLRRIDLNYLNNYGATL